MRRLLLSAVAAAAALLVCAPVPPAAADAADAAAAAGPEVAFTLQDERITESSGLAASSRHKGVYWTHNDSDDGPYVYAVDSEGKTVATVTLRGIEPRDVEGISVTPDGQVYVGDIGDNMGGTWPEVWIYRFTEPARLADTAVDATRYTVRYADGPRDAEALMVHPKTGRVYIASKKEGGGGLYQGPAQLSADGVNTFTKAGDVPWVTDGSFSPDGTRLALRGYFWAAQYAWRGGRAVDRESLDVPFQRQGESVAYSADGRSVLLGSEGRGSEVYVLQVASGDGEDGKSGADRGAAGSDTGTDDEGGVGVAKLGYGVLGAAVLAGLAMIVFRRKPAK